MRGAGHTGERDKGSQVQVDIKREARRWNV